MGAQRVAHELQIVVQELEHVGSCRRSFRPVKSRRSENHSTALID